MRRSLLGWMGISVLWAAAMAGDATAALAAEGHVALKMGTPPLGLHELPILVAKDRGMFAAEGLDVSVVTMRGGSEAVAALANKSLDVMQGAVAHGINLWEKGQKIKVLVLNQGPRSFTLVVDAKRHTGIKSLDEFRGKKFRIAIPRRGSDGDQLVRYLLTWKGMNPETDVSLIQIPGYHNHLTALEKGEVDAAIMQEPFPTVGIRKGIAKSVVDLFRGEGPELLKKRVWVALMVTEEFYRTRRDIAVKLVKATVRAIDFINTDPAGTLEVTQKHFPSIDTPILQEILGRHAGAFKAEITRAAFEADNQFLKELGMIKTPQRYEDVMAVEMAEHWSPKR